MGTKREREELAAFLRARRRELTPAQVGLPVGRRRRPGGLRREEVAVLAGVSPTWYASLEQGRDIHPSLEVLDSVAQVLTLRPAERRYLYELALGGPPTVEEAGCGERSAQENLVREMISCHDRWPLPVYCYDAAGRVRYWNQACREWLTDFTGLDGTNRNIVSWMFLADEARQRFPEWEDEARDMVARLRAFHSRADLRAERLRLVDELARRSPEFAYWWTAHEVRARSARPRALHHRSHGTRWLALGVLSPADNPTLSIEFHYPLPDG